MDLQKNIQNINQEQKENDLKNKAHELGLWYVNFLEIKVNVSALSIIDKEISKNLKIVCFFAIKNKIRIWLVNSENHEVKDFIQQLKNEWYAININLISDESFSIAFWFYEEVEEKTEFNEKIDSKDNENNENDEDSVNNLDKEEYREEYKEEEKEKKEEENKIDKKFFEDKKFLKNLYIEALKKWASDLHFEAYEEKILVKIRVHWDLQKFMEIDHHLYLRIVMELKHKSRLILNETHIPQDWKFFIELEDRKIDMRISIIPSIYWENIVIRILDPLSTKINLWDLWFYDFQIDQIKKNIFKNQWAVLVSWPTWSWKTSTLYSILKQLNNWNKKIISLEDPVEYHFEWIVQSDVNNKMSFEDGLKACLRHDPDIIMLWEIRTKNSAEIAMQASITGHLMLSTIHTNSAIDTIFRLKNFWIADYLINSSINLIIAQRLTKTLCKHCIQEKEFSESDFNFIKKIDPKIWVKINEMKNWFISKWCEECGFTWIFWRTMISEILEIDDDVRNFLSDFEKKWKSFSDLKKFLKEEKKFLTMQEIWIWKVLKWEVKFDDILWL